jgi:hypothetical protein
MNFKKLCYVPNLFYIRLLFPFNFGVVSDMVGCAVMFAGDKCRVQDFKVFRLYKDIVNDRSR